MNYITIEHPLHTFWERIARLHISDRSGTCGRLLFVRLSHQSRLVLSGLEKLVLGNCEDLTTVYSLTMRTLRTV